MDNAKATIKKNTKRKIKAEFDRSPLKERLKARFVNFYFLSGIGIKIFRFIFLVGIAYIVLFPFFTKIAGSFMSPEDFTDVTVRLIPKNFSLDIYKAVWVDRDYVQALSNTVLVSALVSVLQTFVCCVLAYGIAKYKFKGNNIIFMVVMLTMIIPHRTLRSAMDMNFTYFDIFGMLSLLSGGWSIDLSFLTDLTGKINVLEGLTSALTSVQTGLNDFFASVKILNLPDHSINLKNTIIPFVILSVTGLAFKNGLYIFMLRQFFRGIPDSLEESAYIDGSGDFKTFIRIILPMSVPMMITVFLFSFCWQWTDTFYTNMFFTTEKLSPYMLSQLAGIPKSLDTTGAAQVMYETAIYNTCGIMIIAPLVILYVFLQRYLVEGIERSGLTAE